jgi:undecaprenyl-diphosphatase
MLTLILSHLNAAMCESIPWQRRLHGLEMRVVQYCAGTSQIGVGRIVAITVSKLGNGWVYPPLALLLVLAGGVHARLAVVAGATAIGFGQVLLAVMRRCWPRVRPYQASNLNSLLPVQHPSSFPSGHLMTLSASMTPLVITFPGLIWFAAPLVLLMAWSRMACSHHYPSDVVAGVAMGVAISYPLSVLILGTAR